MSITLRHAVPADAADIAAIYNDAVLNTTAIWNETAVDAANRREWIRARQEAGFPVLVACEEGGAPLGYASYGPWRAFDGFRLTVEHSVYVAASARGLGLGRALMEALIAEAKRQGLHVMVAAIEAGNAPSLRLHESLGFTRGPVMREVGQKFGRWLDLAMMELRLDARPSP